MATIFTTTDNAAVDGTADPDTIVVRGSHDTISGFGGDDTIVGVGDANTLYGDSLVQGGPDAGTGSDVLVGGPGDDTLWGGFGPDTLQGGGGADAFSFGFVPQATLPVLDSTLQNPDLIADFRQADHDTIDLSAYRIVPSAPVAFLGTGAFTDAFALQIRYEARDGYTAVQFLVPENDDPSRPEPQTGEIHLAGAIDLTAADFAPASGGLGVQAAGTFHPLDDASGSDLAPAPAEVAVSDQAAAPEAPTLSQFINAANAVYSRDYSNLPPDLTPFPVGGQPGMEVTADGFYGAAFVTPDRQVIVSFEGTHTSAFETQPEFVLAQIAADIQIYLGQTPAAFLDAEAFADEAVQAAAAAGIGRDDVFVTGHSLGAGEAMYVAARLGFAGETFAAPGVAAAAIPPDAASDLVNYVEYGDPIGNYSANPDLLNGFLHSPDILRFGGASYIGDPLAGIPLVAAGALFAPGTTPDERYAGLAALGGLAALYHPLTTYAADLDVPLADPSDPGSGELFAELVARLAGGGLPVEGAVIA